MKLATPAPPSELFSWWCPHRNRCGDRTLTVRDLQRTAGCVRDTRGAAAAAVDHRVEAIALLLEACHDRPLQRTAARQLDAHRVDEAAVDEDFVVDVGRLVAVVVLQADIFAIAAFPADLFDDSVAGGEDRRAVGGGPVDAGMHLDVAEDRMAAATEAGAHDCVVDGLAHQELLRALAALVVVVDDAVVGGLEAVVLLG